MTAETLQVIYNDALIFAYGATRDECLAMARSAYEDFSEDDVEERPIDGGNYGEGMFWGETTPALSEEILAGYGERYQISENGFLDVAE